MTGFQVSRSVVLLSVLGLGACSLTASSEDGSDLYMDFERTDGAASSENWLPDFPDQSDLAIVLDINDEAIIKASTRDARRDALLPQDWLSRVNEAFSGTEVEDALEVENTYEEWRLVSVRVSPCQTLGLVPGADTDVLCWPTVRLVWQPVMPDFRLSWGYEVPFYADDRAIHAIYPVHPRYPDGSRAPHRIRDEIRSFLESGGNFRNIPSDAVNAFRRARDSTVEWLLSEVHGLRGDNLPEGSWSGFEVRPELYAGSLTAREFAESLETFLGEVAQNRDLAEMTAFSLPEGRDPAGTDIWVFVAFDGNGGDPEQKELTVIGRDSGDELVNMGLSQTVGVGIEDPVVQAEIDAGNQELEDSLIIEGEDIARMTDEISDPYEFLVPNTSCASCHRLNDDLRFNLHALSGFENDGVTVSPRVVGDVARDLGWVRSAGF